MATQFSMIDIFNAALLEEGFDEVSTNDGSDEFRLLSRAWPLIVEAELEIGNLNFTRRQALLQNQNTGKFGFAYAYLIPGDAIHVRSLWTLDDDGGRVGNPWGQDGTNVFTDAESSVYIEYLAVPDPSFWSANFAIGVQKRLQAALLNFREDRSAAQAMVQEAESYFQRARTKSSQARSKAPAYIRGEIARARFRNG